MNQFQRASLPTNDYDDDDDRPLATYLRSNRYHESRPLIDQINNAWLNEKTDGLLSDDEDDPPELVHWCDLDSEESLVGSFFALSRTRRFRRRMLLLIITVLSIYFGYRWFLKPDWDRERILMKGFNNPTGTFGTEDPQKFKGIIQLQELQAEYRPGGDHDPEGKRRLIFVGDIHGCREELQDLMRKVKFNRKTDHLICTGDVVAKGPDSLGVIDTLIALNASSVRGNHEDKVLIAGDRTSETAKLDEDTRKSKAAGLKGEALAPYLHPYQLKWLRSLPLIIHIPALSAPRIASPPPASESQMVDSEDDQNPEPETINPSNKQDKKKKKKKKNHNHSVPDIQTDIHIVHGGLVPGLALSRQDPYAIMNMRSMSPSSHVPSRERDKGVPWERIWGWYNDRLSKRQRTKSFSWFKEDYDVAPQAPSAGGGEKGWLDWLGGFFGRGGGGEGGGAAGVVAKLKNEKPAVVVYGHDSPRGLNLHRWSKGLDSGCVNGRELTALVVDAWGRAHLVQTKCRHKR